MKRLWVLALATVLTSCQHPPQSVTATGLEDQSPQRVSVPAAVVPVAAPSAMATPATRLTVKLAFPAGTLSLLKKTLRTQAQIDPKDLSTSDLAKLLVDLDGKPLPTEHLQFTGLEQDLGGQILVTLTIADTAFKEGQLLRVKLPTRGITLFSILSGGSPSLTVDLLSTAGVLLRQAIAKSAKPQANPSPEAVQALANRLNDSILHPTSADPLESSAVNGAIAKLTAAIMQGLPPAQQVAALNASQTSGGGGGGGGGNSSPAPSSSPPAAPTPTITSISPSTGYRHQEHLVTINGTNFAEGVTVTVGGQTMTVLLDEPDQIVLTVPAGITAGAHDVIITNPSGKTVTLTHGYLATATDTGVAITFESGDPFEGTPEGGDGNGDD